MEDTRDYKLFVVDGTALVVCTTLVTIGLIGITTMICITVGDVTKMKTTAKNTPTTK